MASILKWIACAEPEWDQALRLKEANENDPIVSEAGSLVTDYFSGPDQMGMIRMRESKYFKPSLQIESFMGTLKDLFLYRAGL